MAQDISESSPRIIARQVLSSTSKMNARTMLFKGKELIR